MIPVPSGVLVWIATEHADMRRGIQGQALEVQEALKRDAQTAAQICGIDGNQRRIGAKDGGDLPHRRARVSLHLGWQVCPGNPD